VELAILEIRRVHRPVVDVLVGIFVLLDSHHRVVYCFAKSLVTESGAKVGFQLIHHEIILQHPVLLISGA